jgi:spoIIIJ-associated protein
MNETTPRPPEGGIVEIEGSTVEEATAAGLARLGLPAADAEVSVLDAGARGFLGIGSRPARVRVAAKDRIGPTARRITAKLLELMGITAEISCREAGGGVTLDIRSGETDGLLIGRKGETLAALQHVIVRMASRQLNGQGGEVRVDVAGYRGRREDQLRQLARNLAGRVERTRRRAMTEPLTPAERRVVHRTLAEIPGVETHAAGSGVNKRVVLIPARQSEPDPGSARAERGGP